MILRGVLVFGSLVLGLRFLPTRDVARFTSHVQSCEQPDLLQDSFDPGMGGKTRNIAIQLVL